MDEAAAGARDTLAAHRREEALLVLGLAQPRRLLALHALARAGRPFGLLAAAGLDELREPRQRLDGLLRAEHEKAPRRVVGGATGPVVVVVASRGGHRSLDARAALGDVGEQQALGVLGWRWPKCAATPH